MARQLLAGRAVGLLAHWGTRITSESPDPLALRILSEGRGRVRHRPGSPTHESNAGRSGARSWAEKPFIGPLADVATASAWSILRAPASQRR